jgi:O-antigen ligase
LLAHRLGWPRIAPGLATCAVVASVGLADGGLFPRTWRLATIALCALAGAGLLARARVAISPLQWASLAALAGFAGFTAISAIWSTRPTDALLEAERSLTYVAALFAVTILVDRRSLVHVLMGVLAGATIVAGYGLAIYLFTSPPLDPFEGRLLYQPIGYANALGILIAVGVAISVGLAAAAKRRALLAAALIPLALLMPALLLTSSRGAWIALAFGLLLLLVLRGWPRAAFAGLVAIVITALVLVAAGFPASRFAGENRLHYWNVALREYADNPWLGSGAGTYVDYWLRYRPVDSFSRTAHSLYLQALGELGAIGLLLVVLALALPLAALWRRRDPLLAAAVGAYVAYILHTGVDWDWQLPAPTLAGLFCGGAALAAGGGDRRPLSRRARFILLGPTLALVAFAGFRLKTGTSSPFAP